MKVRQKLAMLLAAAMTLTALPAMTFANSDNRMTREVLIVEKDVPMEGINAGGLSMVFKDANYLLDAGVYQEEVFYLELENAEFAANYETATVAQWDYDAAVGRYVTTTPGAVTPVLLNRIGDKTVKVTLTPKDRARLYNFPLLVTPKGGDATVAVVRKGAGGTFSEGKWVFATTADKKATWKADDANAFYLDGTLAPVTFTEVYKGSIGGKTGTETFEVTYELQDADFKFNFPNSTYDGIVSVDGISYDRYVLTVASKYVAYNYGFAGKTAAPVTALVRRDDSGSVTFLIKPDVAAPDSLGTVEIKNIPVRSTVKAPQIGNLLVDISSNKDQLVDEKNDVALAVITKYTTVIEMKDNKPVEIQAGRNKEIEFTVKELVDDSMVGDREVEITLVDENAYFLPGTKALSSYVKDFDKSDNIVQSISFNEDDKNILIVKLKPGLQINGEKDSFTIKIPVHVAIDKKDKGEVIIKAEGRALENETQTTAVTIKNPVNFEIEPFTVKVGLQGQVGGKVVITETEKAMLDRGDITFEIVDRDGKAVKGVDFHKDAKISVTGNLQRADLGDVTTLGSVAVTIKRVSKEASAITVSDFDVTVDRTVPEGKYDLKITGKSIDPLNSYTLKDFFIVGTPNTEALAANGLRRGVAQFVIGSNKYIAMGKEFEMDAASYIQDPGYTMVPVRFVAEAFGVGGKDILFSGGVVTIFAGTRTVQLKSGSDIAVVNGASIKMDTAVVIKDGRTYAPIGEVAKILGIARDWDNSTKTATFTNN